MNGAAGGWLQEVSERGEPAEARALVVFACGEQQVRRTVVVDIFAVDGVCNVDRTLAFTWHCLSRREEDASYSHDVTDWACQEGN